MGSTKQEYEFNVNIGGHSIPTKLTVIDNTTTDNKTIKIEYDDEHEDDIKIILNESTWTHLKSYMFYKAGSTGIPIWSAQSMANRFGIDVDKQQELKQDLKEVLEKHNCTPLTSNNPKQ